jgi:hypothetical protein
MHDYVMIDDSLMLTPNALTRSRPQIVLLAAAFTALVSVTLCAAAVLAPAPTAVVPLVVIICVGAPLFAGWEVPIALACLRSRRSAGRAVAALKRALAQVPETEHPLGYE